MKSTFFYYLKIVIFTVLAIVIYIAVSQYYLNKNSKNTGAEEMGSIISELQNDPDVANMKV